MFVYKSFYIKYKYKKIMYLRIKYQM